MKSNLFRFLLQYVIIFLMVTLASCSHNNPVSSSQSNSVVIPSTTKLLDSVNYTLFFVGLSSDSSTYTFKSGLPVLDTLHVGDVLVSNYRQGLLKKVTSIGTSNGQIVVGTTPATLTNAIMQCKIVASSLPMQPSRAYNPKGPIPLGSALNVEENKIEIVNLEIKDGDSQVVATLNGSITLDPELNFELTIQNAKITHFLATVNLNETTDLTGVAILFNSGFSAEKQIFSEVMDPIIILAGDIPIVVTPILQVNVGADGDVTASVSTGATYNQNYTAGISWDNGIWSPVASQTQTFSYQPPQFSSEADFKAYTTPTFSMLLYGVVGPFVDATLYGHFNALIGRTPLALFEVGLNVSGGLAAGVLSDDIQPLTIPNIIDFHDTLWKSDTATVSTGGKDTSHLPTDPVIYLPFDGSANDASGNGYNGVIHGNVIFISNRFNQPNSACQFDGSSYIDISNTDSLNFATGGFSVCAWTSYTNVDDEDIVVKHSPCGINNGYGLGAGRYVPNALSFITPGGSCGGTDRINTPTAYNDGKWHFAVGTYDGTTSKLYVDGVLITSCSSGYGQKALGDILVGKAGTCGSFHGSIDDVRIFSRALTPSEIQALYNEK
jgi:hypothetical protein